MMSSPHAILGRLPQRANHERLAAESVALAGFETFTPRIRVKRGVRWRTTPLFGSYFFVRVVDRWRILERTKIAAALGYRK